MHAGPTDEQLHPYGFHRGKKERWCASCTRLFQNGAKTAFKCRPCAVSQFDEVERICADAGMET